MAGVLNTTYIYQFGINVQNFLFCLMLLLITIIMFIDFKYLEIPDELNISLFLLGVGNLILNYKNIGTYFKGGIVAFGLFFLIALITKGGLGGGDIKMITGLGLLTGLSKILLIIYISYVIGAIIAILLILFKKKQLAEHIAFGPYITLATISVIIILPNMNYLF